MSREATINVLNRDSHSLRRTPGVTGAGAFVIAVFGIVAPMVVAASAASTDPAENEGDEDKLTAENLIETLRGRYIALDSYEDEVVFREVQKIEGEDKREFTRKRQSLAFTSDGRLAFKSVSSGYEKPQVNAVLSCDGERFVEVRPGQQQFREYRPAESIGELLDLLEPGQDGQNEAAYHPALALFEALADNRENIYFPQGAAITSLDDEEIDDEGGRTISGTIGHQLPFTLVLDAEHGIVRQLKLDLAPMAHEFARAHDEDPVTERYELLFEVEQQAVNKPIDKDRFIADVPAEYERVGR